MGAASSVAANARGAASVLAAAATAAASSGVAGDSAVVASAAPAAVAVAVAVGGVAPEVALAGAAGAVGCRWKGPALRKAAAPAGEEEALEARGCGLPRPRAAMIADLPRPRPLCDERRGQKGWERVGE